MTFALKEPKGPLQREREHGALERGNARAEFEFETPLLIRIGYCCVAFRWDLPDDCDVI